MVSVNLNQIRLFCFIRMHSKMLSAKCQPFCPGVNELTNKVMFSSHRTCCIMNISCHSRVPAASFARTQLMRTPTSPTTGMMQRDIIVSIVPNGGLHMVLLKSINSLAPGKFEWNFRYLIFQIISVIDGWGISCELALRWMSLDPTDDKSTLVQVMAWCRQATSHYLSQCWPRSMSPYGVTRPQWVIFSYNITVFELQKRNFKKRIVHVCW